MHCNHLTFWQRLDDLVNSHQVVVERPKGTHHPRFPEIVYPLDYGYLQNTQSSDGAALDVWVGSLGQTPGANKVVAIVCTVDLLKRDAEIKLLVGCNTEDQQTILHFHNGGPQSAMLICRPSDGNSPK